MNGTVSLSPSEAAYKTARSQAKGIQNPQLRIDQWKEYPDAAFGGDIKIVERKADTAPHVESEVPRYALHISMSISSYAMHYFVNCVYISYLFSYLHDRNISIVVVDASGSEFDSVKLESDGLKKVNGNEIR